MRVGALMSSFVSVSLSLVVTSAPLLPSSGLNVHVSLLPFQPSAEDAERVRARDEAAAARTKEPAAAQSALSSVARPETNAQVA